MTSIVLPIGRSLGPTYSAEGELEYTEVFLGAETIELDDVALTAWTLARSDADAHNEHRFTREHLRDLLVEAEADGDPTATIEELFKRGALAEVDLELDDLRPLLARHKLIPTANAFGNTPETPAWYGIGKGTDEVDINLGATTHYLWATGHRHTSMWDAVADFVAGTDLDADEIAAELASALPIVLAADCGYLETV
ncbi:hypothetical protein Afil01_65020 [Actinorhabdospora filicis]|uniref:Uncharacterized protein n=1 Tax=Actinorhabdospora filicis TaxID=1785913 RepID=A0A9W6WEA8_9ACTN|nr:hypothetical protein [Actinorhabdospora filicis]GLZ81695.1 hypothetical protein Afil01_65020 [Actinorhabdospora filicis]